MQKITLILDKIFQIIGIICVILLVLTTLNIIFDVVMRYAFNNVSIAMQELEWHLFASTFLLGISYALRYDGHVRVDFLYEKFSNKNKALINMVGVVLFVIPLAMLIVWYGLDFTANAYEMAEQSGDPGGLTHRWIIKAMIPLSFIMVILAAVHMFFDNLITFLTHK
jgi:TRAP-type mannitol/chloroaromatic compound transport system permease small subunit